jgi:hypothetical protein
MKASLYSERLMALIGAVVWEAGASTSINEGAIWDFDEIE